MNNGTDDAIDRRSMCGVRVVCRRCAMGFIYMISAKLHKDSIWQDFFIPIFQ